jgi:hypothetical protein
MFFFFLPIWRVSKEFKPRAWWTLERKESDTGLAVRGLGDWLLWALAGAGPVRRRERHVERD